MISDRELLQSCTSPVLERGRSIALAREPKLSHLRCHRDGRDTRLTADVAGTTNRFATYRTAAVIDEDAGYYLSGSCTCPAFGQYRGVCKHIVALVITFNRMPEAFEGYSRARHRETSRGLASYLRMPEAFPLPGADARAEGPRDPNGVCREPACGSVRLEPTFELDYRGWLLRLKVSVPGASYVIPSMTGLVDDMRDRQLVSYGKKLAFTHDPAVLDARSRALYELVDQAVTMRDELSSIAGGVHLGTGSARDLLLTDREAASVLELFLGDAVGLVRERNGRRAARPAPVVEGDPNLGLALRRVDDEASHGYELRHARTLAHMMRGSDATYALALDGDRETFHRCSPEFAASEPLLLVLFADTSTAPFVDDEDLESFCREALPQLGDGRAVEADVPPELERRRPVPCRIELFCDHAPQGVTCSVAARYGTARVALVGQAPDDGVAAAGAEVTRDPARERAALSTVARYFSMPAAPARAGEPALIADEDDDALERLLAEGLDELRQVGSLLTTPDFDRVLGTREPHLRLGLSVSSGLVEVSPIADEVPPEEVGELLASYRRRRRFHRLRDGSFLDLSRAAESGLDELDRIAGELGIDEERLGAGAVELPGFDAFYLDHELGGAERDASFDAYLEGFRAIDPDAYEPPATLAATMRPYQVEGFRWLSAVCDRGFGGILADEMGLGKSLQLISLLLARREEAREAGPSLVVCPASLVYNWVAEFDRFAPEMSVEVVAGTKPQRREAWERAAGAGRPEVLVTSYDLLRRDVAEARDLQLFCLALDEAQYIKNQQTKVARATKSLRARHRFALTGTPIENRLSELWSIFDFLMPGILGPYTRFQERFERPILDGDETAAARLQALVGPFILRRLKADVLRDLPEKLEGTMLVQLEGEQRRLYAAHEQRLRASLAKTGEHEFKTGKIQVLAELTRLRQICCDPRLVYEDAPDGSAKLEAIGELVATCQDSGTKMLVFSQFTSFLTLIAQRLDAQGVPYYVITGATPKRRRLELVDAFNADDTPVFLISLRAGNTGLNLTGATVVVHADPWWNVAAQDQATDRAHRIGQTHAVSVYQVVAKDTIEERILRMQQAKRELAEQFVGGAGAGAGGIASLTREELLDLLG